MGLGANRCDLGFPGHQDLAGRAGIMGAANPGCFGEKAKESTCEQCRIQLYTAAAESIPRARIAP